MSLSTPNETFLMSLTGLLHPTLIPSYGAVLASVVMVIASLRNLAHADRKTNRPQNLSLQRTKWLALVVCFSALGLKSIARIWHLAPDPQRSFVDESWWQHLWILFVLAAACAAVLALYLHFNDRPFPPGHCRKCGYNLQANISGTSPECGTNIANNKKRLQ